MSARVEAWAWLVDGALVHQHPFRAGAPRDPDLGPKKRGDLRIGDTLTALSLSGAPIEYRGRVTVSRRRPLLTYFPARVL